MIRCAKKEDLNAILAIYNDAIINTTAVYTYKPQTIDERIAWFETKQRNHEPIFVFEENGSVLGFATFGSFRPWPANILSSILFMSMLQLEEKVSLVNYYSV